MSNVVLIGLLQALGLASYISLIAVFIQNAIKWFGPLNNFTGPIIMLTLLSLSVLICGFIALGYPIKLFFVKKQPQKAIKVVAFTALFLLIFLGLFIAGVAIFK